MRCHWKHNVNCDTCLWHRWVTDSIPYIIYSLYYVYIGLIYTRHQHHDNCMEKPETRHNGANAAICNNLTHITVWLICAICAFHQVFINHCFLYCGKMVHLSCHHIKDYLCAPYVSSKWRFKRSCLGTANLSHSNKLIAIILIYDIYD